jgi:hypothetical protein
MRHRKPVDILAMHEKRERIYRLERGTTRLGLFAGVPVVAAVLLTIKVSHVWQTQWPETILPPIGLAIFCLFGWGCAELSWKWWCRDKAARRALAAAGSDA